MRGATDVRAHRGAPVRTPSSRFVRALALGDTRALGDRDWDVLRATGLTHLIAISGFHVGLVAGFGALLARGLWLLWPALALRLPRADSGGRVAACFGAAAVCGACGFRAADGAHAADDRGRAGCACLSAADRGAPRRWRWRASRCCWPIRSRLLGAGFWLSFLGVAWLLCCLPRGSGQRRCATSCRRRAWRRSGCCR